MNVYRGSETAGLVTIWLGVQVTPTLALLFRDTIATTVLLYTSTALYELAASTVAQLLVSESECCFACLFLVACLFA
jgi:hypothetical protein